MMKSSLANNNNNKNSSLMRWFVTYVVSLVDIITDLLHPLLGKVGRSSSIALRSKIGRISSKARVGAYIGRGGDKAVWKAFAIVVHQVAIK